MHLESEREDSQDVSFPMSIVYNDSDTLAHRSVSLKLEQNVLRLSAVYILAVSEQSIIHFITSLVL